jgi:hypothetical protein
VPTALVNGRLSTRSFARRQWRPCDRSPDDVADAQPLPDAVGPGHRPYIALGAEARVRRTGIPIRPADTSLARVDTLMGSSWASGYGTVVCGRQYPSR